MRRGSGDVLDEVVKVYGLITTPVVAHPSSPDGVPVEAEHVEHPHVCNHAAEQLGGLVQARSDEESSVRSSRDGDLVRRCDLLRVQVLGSEDEVIKDILLLLLDSSEVPGLPVLASSSDVGDGEDSLVVLDPGEE